MLNLGGSIPTLRNFECSKLLYCADFLDTEKQTLLTSAIFVRLPGGVCSNKKGIRKP